MIISALDTFRLDPKHSLREIVRYFDPVEVEAENGKSKAKEYPNRYFVMLYNEQISDGKALSERKYASFFFYW